jgi:hypothetical protein
MSKECCPNCGANSWSDKKGFVCNSCNYKVVEFSEKESIKIVYCSLCGCHYSNCCSLHNFDYCKEVKFGW